MPDHSIVHIEIPASNTETAGAFYGDLFGWKITLDSNMNYRMFQPDSGPGGGYVQIGASDDMYRPGEVLLYVSTDDIDATLAKVEELGGKTVVPKTEIPTVGWFGIFTDPAGNRMALFTSTGQQG